jgi:hypothetical protein
MAKKKKKSPPPPAGPEFPPEERTAEAATILWMLTALFTFCAELIGLLAKVYLVNVPELDESMQRLLLLPYITLGIGVVSGILCLLLTPVVYRLRKTPPPPLITVFAVLIGSAPLMTLLIQWLRG